MKKIVICAIFVISLVAISSPSYGIDIFNKLQYKEVKLSSGAYVLVNRFTGEVKYYWAAAAELDPLIRKSVEKRARGEGGIAEEYFASKADNYDPSNYIYYPPSTGKGKWVVPNPNQIMQLQRQYDVDNAPR